ncbi:hypothetical protein N656DRAFT_774391 [Canariomyces notabilis]|uniref:DUF1772-domain-containing protein n=1 Tax=Canariomyces notabilis TaxID=2074819 RepID=A0AAN6TKP6_9PEZI|nr:hypothetical protein N656DRAFT_774391 [Canariomyces arenarius]
MASDHPTLVHRTLQTTIPLVSSITAGLSLSLSFFMVPRLLEAPVAVMLQQWQCTYRQGAVTMVPLCLVSGVSYLWLALQHTSSSSAAGAGMLSSWRGKSFLAAGLLTAGVVPYTAAFMMGTNRRLMERADREAAAKGKVTEFSDKILEQEKSAKALVDWWGVLNLVRGVMLTVGSACGLAAATATAA